MIQFNWTGNPYPSFQEQEEDKIFFINKLGPFKEEFEAKGGSVVFNYLYPAESNSRISFNLTKSPADLGGFIIRWNEYIRGLKEDAS